MLFNIRERSQKVAAYLQQNVKLRLAQIATLTGMSRSSVHRHRKGLAQRNQYPESSLWETAEGQAWLKRLVVAVVYFFGLKQGLGADSLSEFLRAIHLHTHVGVSASALRQLERQLSERIAEYAAHQAQQIAETEPRDICVAADETFFDLPILVLMELASGFIFTEVISPQRDYVTWQSKLQSWWNPEQWRCHFFVSDGAKALVKLATDGLSSVNVADLFHGLRALGQPMGQAFSRQLAGLNKQIEKLEVVLKRRSGQTAAQQQAKLDALTIQYEQIRAEQHTYHAALAQISQTIHPFPLTGGQWQLANRLQTALEPPLQALSQLTAYGGEAAESAIETFRTLIPSWSHGINAWGQWVVHSLDQKTQDGAIQSWVLLILLPWVYWSVQAEKARKQVHQQCYKTAASDAFDTLMADPMTEQLTSAQLQEWHDWCRARVAQYQRSSSAVEGRNGYLSQRHHVTRGFSPQSLAVLTTLHNFDLKRSDNTTAAQRLFGRPFPDLFESILTQVGELPLPRKSRQSSRRQMA
jgi:predicted DNA-binding transcriptional regulator AlpA